MNTRERALLSGWQDYITRLHRFFIKKTSSKAILADFYAAILDEIVYLRRQYPGVQEKKIIDRAYKRLLEAYERSAEYPVYLSWRSIAVFVAQRRPGIAWAVLQARADHKASEKPVVKDKEVPFMAKKIRSTSLAYCPFCFMTSRVTRGAYECCGKRVQIEVDV